MDRDKAYFDAQKDMLKALMSFNNLDNDQKMHLLNEISMATIGVTLCEIMELMKKF